MTELQHTIAPYMLRRVKSDVEKSIPMKEETIIDVELTTLQKHYYRAIFERNRSFLYRGCSSSNLPSLTNVEMQLRKCCNHPFLVPNAEAVITGTALPGAAESAEEDDAPAEEEDCCRVPAAVLFWINSICKRY